MQQVWPHYYPQFHCIAGACRHSCCIGWEIDIDPESLARYRSVPGDFGARLRRSISSGQEPHFLLDEDECCPFLNADGLCDIILTLGEGQLCGICADHPRFRNGLPGRVELGLGLCCEEAARLILSQEEPMSLQILGEEECQDPILQLRDQAIRLLQERERSIPERVGQMLSLCHAQLPALPMARWAEFLLSLERLEEDWTEQLQLLLRCGDGVDLAGFEAYMAPRQREYEQLLVYLVYRHMANAFDETELSLRGAFAALGYTILRHLGAIFWQRQGQFPFAQQVELCRLFSSEIEYSEENRDAVLDFLYKNGALN